MISRKADAIKIVNRCRLSVNKRVIPLICSYIETCATCVVTIQRIEHIQVNFATNVIKARIKENIFVGDVAKVKQKLCRQQ